MRPLAWLVATLATALVLAVGCSGGTSEVPAPASSAPEVSAFPDVPGEYELTVPRIGVTRASIAEVGLNADGTIQAPPLDDPGLVGVYRLGPMPGDRGPAVLLGHVNAHHRPGVFSRLRELRVGDAVNVDTPRGPVAFTVYRTATVAKERFPSREVYSNTAGPELRLITCGGPNGLDSSGHSYVDQTIVYARAS